MKRLLTTLLTLLVSVGLAAQQIPVVVVVVDSLDSTPLRGANVEIVSGKDTLRNVADGSGMTMFSYDRLWEGVKYAVSFLGYKTKVGTIGLEDAEKGRVKIRMSVDPETLTEVIITADKVAMVMKGDTTVYNVSAFTTMKGDPLRVLLKQIPGIEIKGDAIFAGGEKVNKILVNGNTLFGTDVRSALDLLYSSEIKDIKVYDQRNQMDYSRPDGSDRKERVIDIITHKALDNLKDLHLSGEVGLPRIAGASLAVYHFGKDAPTVRLNGAYLKNDPSYGATPYDKADIAGFIENNNRAKKMILSNALAFNYAGASENGFSESVYLPVSGFSDRSDSLWKKNKKRAIEFNDIAGFVKAFNKGADKLDLRMTVSYSGSNETCVDGSVFAINDHRTATLVENAALDRSGSLSLNSSWVHKFSKRGRSLRSEIGLSVSNRRGAASRKDTLGASLLPMDLSMESEGSAMTPTFSINYSEPLSRKSNLGVSGVVQSGISHSRRVSFDELAGLQDMTNSYDYSEKNSIAKLSSNYTVRSGNNELSLFAVLSGASRDRIELTPGQEGYSKIFLHLSPELRFRYGKGPLRFSGSYNERQTVPSSYELRPVVDNRSSTILHAGNPTLKQSVQRNAEVQGNYTSQKLQTVFTVSLKGAFTENAFANKLILFPAETSLDQYGYTFPAGSRLTIPVNVRGKSSIDMDIAASTRVSKMRSTLRPGFGVSYGSNPLFLGDSMVANADLGTRWSADVNSVFTQKLSMNVNALYARNNSFSNGSKELVTNTVSVVASMTANPFERIWLEPYLSYYHLSSDNPMPDYSKLQISFKLAYRIGAHNNREVGLHVHDLLNNTSAESMSLTDMMITRSISSTLGRGVLLYFNYKFR